MNSDLYKILRQDIYRGFMGDILVEGLFFECMFKNMRKKLSKVNEIYYPYEGLGWEKILCRTLYGKTYTIASICSVPIDNFLHYWADKKEVKLMQEQNVLPSVFQPLGRDSKRKFTELFEYVEEQNKNRFTSIEYLSKRSNSNEPYISIILGSKEKENQEIIKWVKEHYTNKENNKNIRIKKHPDNILEYGDYEYALGDLNLLLAMSSEVILKRSSVAITAAIAGCKVIVPELKFYNVDYCPLKKEYRNRQLNMQERQELYKEHFGV